jgi:hypothetical protein
MKPDSEFEQAQMDVNDAERTLQTLNQQLTEAETAVSGTNVHVVSVH